jgi:hypothetical protein
MCSKRQQYQCMWPVPFMIARLNTKKRIHWFKPLGKLPCFQNRCCLGHLDGVRNALPFLVICDNRWKIYQRSDSDNNLYESKCLVDLQTLEAEWLQVRLEKIFFIWVSAAQLLILTLMIISNSLEKLKIYLWKIGVIYYLETFVLNQLFKSINYKKLTSSIKVPDITSMQPPLLDCVFSSLYIVEIP